MASMKFERLTGTTVATTRIRLTFTPDNPSHMPVLVDFWRQDSDTTRDIHQVWGDLVQGYGGTTAASVQIDETTITQQLN